MKVVWVENGLRVIELTNRTLRFEARCLDPDCAEEFFTKGSYSTSPHCPSCGKDNTDYVSEHDINTIEIARI